MASFQIIPSAIGMVIVLGLISASSIRFKMTEKTGLRSSEVDVGIQESISDGNVQMALNPKRNVTDSVDANFDCECGGSHCRCCRNIRISWYPRYCCVLVDYRYHSDSLGFSLQFGHRQLFDREISLSDHRPVCGRLALLPPIILCLRLNDVRIWGHRDRACAVVTIRSFYRRRRYRMGCFSVTYRDQDERPTGSIGPNNYGAEDQMFLPADWMEDGGADPVPEGSDLDEERP